MAYVLLAACATASDKRAPEKPRAAERWNYDVWIDRDLDTAVVRLCFFEPVPRRLVARKRGLPFISEVLDDESNERLARDGDGWLMRSGARCVRYKADLAAAASFSVRPDLAVRVGDAVVFTPELIFLRPASVKLTAEITATLSAWGDREVSAPWERDASGVYHFGFNALWWRCYMAVGDFGREQIKVAGATLDVAFIDERSFPDRQRYTAWLRSSAEAVATLYGSLPVDRLQVLIVPAPFPGDDPVMFGMVVRGGHPSAILLVRDDVPKERFAGEWVAVHELSHLALPFVKRDEMWMSEGFATWAQQVLRVRAGQLDERDAWGRFLRGLESARGSDVNRIPHVYWAGAAWWLLADLHLRELGSSVGEAVAPIRACCFQSPRSSTADEVIALISETTPAFGAWARELAPPLVDAPEQAIAALRKMGVRYIDDSVVLSEDALHTRARRAVLSTPVEHLPETAAEPSLLPSGSW